MGMQGYGPTVCVGLPDDEDTDVELAQVMEPIYSVTPQRNPDGTPDYDTGERYLPGNMDQNGLLMAGSKGLLGAAQTVLKDLYDEHRQKATGLFSVDLQRIQRHIQVLEQAIRDAVIFPTDS